MARSGLHWLLLGGVLVSGCVLDNPFKFKAPPVEDDDPPPPQMEAGPIPTTELDTWRPPPSDGGQQQRTQRMDAEAGPFKCTDDDQCEDPGECQFALCRKSTGECIVSHERSGTDCSENDGLRCHEGDCVTCRQDKNKNDEETDVDCGGPYCEGCAADKICNLDSDCASLICLKDNDAAATGVCAAASCIDGIKNGDEGGPDCGGSCEQLCELGVACERADDCTTNFCVDGICCGTACEGTCRSCQPGTGVCSLAADGTDPRGQCGDSTCNGAGACAQCTDGVKNGDESAIDCGGDCAPCELGQACDEPGDCASCVCLNKQCAAPNCSNGVADGCETDIDCGGPCGPFCGLQQVCRVKSDCFETFTCQFADEESTCQLP